MTTTTTAIQAVLIDPRQPAILDHIGYEGAPVTRAALAAGSLNIVAHDGAILAVERLPVESLTSAIRNHTLGARAAALRALTPWAYLVLVGDLTEGRDGKAVINGRPGGWDWRSVQGALMGVQELGCMVLSCHSDDRLSDLLTTLARRDRGKARIQPTREALFATPGEVMLTAIPGIGDERAEQLLEQTGSPAAALVALTEPDYAPAGVGPKTIEAARRALGLQENERLNIDLRY